MNLGIRKSIEKGIIFGTFLYKLDTVKAVFPIIKMQLITMKNILKDIFRDKELITISTHTYLYTKTARGKTTDSSLFCVTI